MNFIILIFQKRKLTHTSLKCTQGLIMGNNKSSRQTCRTANSPQSNGGVIIGVRPYTTIELIEELLSLHGVMGRKAGSEVEETRNMLESKRSLYLALPPQFSTWQITFRRSWCPLSHGCAWTWPGTWTFLRSTSYGCWRSCERDSALCQHGELENLLSQTCAALVPDILH